MKKLTCRSFAAIMVGGVLALGTGISSCGVDKPAKFRVNGSDSIIFEAGKAQDYHRILTLTDSLEQEGSITEVNANRWRGVAYNHLGQTRNAEMYYQKVMDANINNDRDKLSYIKSARRLAELLVKRGEFEDGLRVALTGVEKMKEWDNYSPKDVAISLNTIGRCQLNLGRFKEAAESYERAYQYYLKQIAEGASTLDQNEAIIGTDQISLDYINARMFAEAQVWTERTDSLVNLRIKLTPDVYAESIDEYRGRIALHRAIALQGLEQPKEAAQAYQEMTQSVYGKMDEGKIVAAEYLTTAGRYGEAADNYACLDRLLDKQDISLSLDNIRTYLLPKLRANMSANRRDSVVALAARLCDALDSAIVSARNDEAAELATIYDTKQKEAQIAEQRAALSHQQFLATAVVLVLLTVFFVVYTIHRRTMLKRLQHANTKLEDMNQQLQHANTKLEDMNQQLQQANTKLENVNQQLTVANARAEESSKMKTDFIQQISHEIRTPLNILSGFTQIITTPGMELDDATREDINRQIGENTNRITGLVNKMLELSDASSKAVIERTDTVPAIQIAAQAAEDSGITQAAHLTFDMQLGEGAESAMLTTNLAQSTHALVLLLDNAKKFTKPAEAFGGSQPAADTQQRVVLSLELADGMARFVVEDTGIGVPAEEAERIFDEFVQLDEYYDGTGIGLTVSRSIARRLGGDVTLDTTYSPGARFVMTLPL